MVDDSKSLTCVKSIIEFRCSIRTWFLVFIKTNTEMNIVLSVNQSGMSQNMIFSSVYVSLVEKVAKHLLN